MVGVLWIGLFGVLPLLVLMLGPALFGDWFEAQGRRVRRFQHLLEQQIACWDAREQEEGEPWPSRWQRLRTIRSLWHETRWR